MDGRDSSTLAPGEEERPVRPVADAMAKESEELFRSGRFGECVEVLKQLMEKKRSDPKVLHNIIVAEYYRDGCTDPRELLNLLEKVKKRTEELASASGDQLENSVGTNAGPGSKGNGSTQHQLSATDTDSTPYIDEYDTSIVTFNSAVVLYHLHEYKHALSLLEPLYRNIDPIDETTALHVCLLLLDIALASNDASKALHVIQYLEKSFGVGYMSNQLENGSSTQDQSSNQGTKSSTVNNISAPDASTDEPNSSSNTTENSPTGTLTDDALEYENLYSTLDNGGPNFGRPSPNDLVKAAVDRVGSIAELKLKMYLYKVRLLLLARDLKSAKREVKHTMTMARGRDSTSEFFLKSQLEYARGNHRKAIKLLTSSNTGTEAGMLSIFNNNLGCIMYQLKGHHSSSVFFTKALKSGSSLRLEKPLKLSTFSQDKSMFIMYNCGLQNLKCGKPMLAAKCFGQASRVLHNYPVLWLRLAECCIAVLQNSRLRSTEEIKVHVVGSGRWRQLVIDDDRNGFSSEEYGSKFKISFSFARYCLQNVLILLQNEKLDTPEENENENSKPSNYVPNGDSKENKGTTNSISTLQSAVDAYEHTVTKENHMIMQTVLASLAYVELCLENPVRALSTAKSLIDLQKCSRTHRFLAHIYSAEALCYLNRLKEAAEHLTIYLSEENDSQDSILSPQEMRACTYVNMSTTLALAGEIERARKFASEAELLVPKDSRAILAGIYLDIVEGKKEEALSKLKRFGCVSFS